MNNELSTRTYIKLAILIISLPIIILLILTYGDELVRDISNVATEITNNTRIKNMEITEQNYKEIYNIINNSTDITLQEKANFNKNYLLFGKKIIGYKVKDVIKEIQI